MWKLLQNLVSGEYGFQDIQGVNKGMIGDKAWLNPLIESGVRGIERVVPIGKTMDFDLSWLGMI